MKTATKMIAAAGFLAAMGTVASAEPADTQLQWSMYDNAQSSTVEVAPAPRATTVYEGRSATIVEPGTREVWVQTQPREDFEIGYNNHGWGEDFGGNAR